MAGFRARGGARAVQEVVEASKSLPGNDPFKDLKKTVTDAAPDLSKLEPESFQEKVDLEAWPPDLTEMEAEVEKVRAFPDKVGEAVAAAGEAVEAVEDAAAKAKAAGTLETYKAAVEPWLKTLDSAVAELAKHAPKASS